MPEKRRSVMNARAFRRLWAGALCLCMAAPAAQAKIGSGESPVFSYNAYECTEKSKSGMAESPEFFGSYVPVNGDCVVNVLDLIVVRNNLGKVGCDKWNADVNGDCKVNVLDLIAIRNMLGRRCSQ